jgi:hypothetical protein
MASGHCRRGSVESGAGRGAWQSRRSRGTVHGRLSRRSRGASGGRPSDQPSGRLHGRGDGCCRRGRRRKPLLPRFRWLRGDGAACAPTRRSIGRFTCACKGDRWRRSCGFAVVGTGPVGARRRRTRDRMGKTDAGNERGAPTPGPGRGRALPSRERCELRDGIGPRPSDRARSRVLT